MAGNRYVSVGDKETFALNVEFEPDPDIGASAEEEESLSWGSIEVWVRGKNLCAHTEEGMVVNSVRWYLLPLIEWLASNWNPLLHEERLPNRNAADDAWQSLIYTRFPPISFQEPEEDEWSRQWQEWWLRHSLQSCRCGGLFPDIVIRRWQDLVEVSWGNRPLPGIPGGFVFADRGTERLEPKLIAGPLYELLLKTIDYLLHRLPSSQRFHRVAETVSMIKRTPREVRLAWLAGLGSSYAAIKENWDRIASTVQKARQEVADYLLEAVDDGLVIEGSCHAALMFGSAAPALSDDDLEILVNKLTELYNPEEEKSQLRSLVAHAPVGFDGQPAWEIGYNLAERVIERFSLDKQAEDAVDISMILDELGIRQERIRLSDEHIRGVSIAGPRHQPSILINSSDLHNDTPPGERFTHAHELCHILFDRTYGRKLAIVSDKWAPLQVEKRANAFAAMLLMPPELVRRAVASLRIPVTSERAVDEIRKRLGTGFKATLDHLMNLGWLDPTAAEQIAEARDEHLSRQEEGS